MWGAIDPETGITYIYREHYEAEQPIHYHAKIMKEHLDSIPYGRLRFVNGDPKGRARNERDLRSTFDYYAEYGIYFTPAINKVEDGIFKVYNYLSLGKLKVFRSCVNTIREMSSYKYQKVELDAKKTTEIPQQTNDHTPDCIRYMIAELPDNPDDLKAGYAMPMSVSQRREQKHLPHALQDDDHYTAASGDWYSYY